MEIKNVIYEGADRVIFVGKGEKRVEKGIDDLNTLEKAFFMCFFVAEGTNLHKVRREYSWALTLSEFFMLVNEEVSLLEFYEKAKNARLHALEEKLFSETEEDKTQIIKTLSLLRPKDKTTHVTYEITPWHLDKEDEI